MRRALIALGMLSSLAGHVEATSLDQLKSTFRRPAEIPFPEDNPYTPQKAELGKILYFDPRLSRVGALSCAGCHNPSFGWEDGRPLAIGDNMGVLARHSPTVLNHAWSEAFFWDGRAWTLEQQALGPISAPGEMNMPLDRLVEVLSNSPGYRSRFESVFPGRGIEPLAVAQAIATFERTIVSSRSPFDLWVEGDEAAISEQAKQGFELFNGKADCAACHAGWRFTNDSFHDIGLPAAEDPGRGKLFPDTPELMHAFKTPSLRNISQRAPFMHDGSITTLEGVVRHYSGGVVQRPTTSQELPRIDLSSDQIASLVAFLETLTSRDPPMPVPVLP